eukprot:1008638_1
MIMQNYSGRRCLAIFRAAMILGLLIDVTLAVVPVDHGSKLADHHTGDHSSTNTAATQPATDSMFDSILGGALISVAALLAAGAGIGGGGLYLPVFVVVLKYDPHLAVPLSKATIVGVAYGGYLVNYRRRHPLADRPLIDYDIALLFEPMLLAGTMLGVGMNVVFPSY